MSELVHRPVCELCGSTRKACLYSVPFSDPRVLAFVDTYYEGRVDQRCLQGGVYEIVKCLDCGFIWQAYVLNENGMRELYENWISAEHSLAKKKFAGLGLYDEYARQVRTAIRHFGKKPFELNVLDFGMGWGYWCLMAKAFGCNVHGFETSHARVRYAEQRGLDVFADLTEVCGQRFDFINAEQVFEHVVQPRELLTAVAATLKPSGVVYLSVPNGLHIEESVARPEWRPSKDPVQPLEHVNCFVHETLLRLAESSGLKLLDGPLGNSTNDRPGGAGVGGFLRSVLGRRSRQRRQGTKLYFRRL